MQELVAKRYAKALQGVSSDIKKDLKSLESLSTIFGDSQISRMLSSPIIKKGNKVDLLLDAMDGASDLLKHFIEVLGEKNRLPLIPQIVKIIQATLRAKKGQFDGVVYSSDKIEKEELERLQNSIERYAGAKIKLKSKKSKNDGMRAVVEDLGIEVGFSRQNIKEQLIEHIKRSI